MRGARDLGFSTEGGADRLRAAVDAGQVRVLYVLDPGPDGSLGDINWIIAARQEGKIQALVVQGVLKSSLVDAADVVLPGSAWVEKDATYTNAAGLVQAASRVIMPPGDAVEDWQILAKLGVVFGHASNYVSADAVRDAVARALAHIPGQQVCSQYSIATPGNGNNCRSTDREGGV